MAKYYVSNAGSDSNTGVSPSTPFKTIQKINNLPLKAGDMVHFKTGDTFYGSIVPPILSSTDNPIILTSYGDGVNPIISGYKIVVTQANWIEHAANVWKVNLADTSKYTGDIYTTDVNIGFLKVDGVIKPSKKWDLASLATQWDFYSDETQWLYVFSSANPNSIAATISAARSGNLISLTNCVKILNLELIGTGSAGIKSSDAISNVVIKNNIIHEVGGSRLIGAAENARWGNGIEIWSEATNILIENNKIFDVYDVAYTMQGDVISIGWDNVAFRGNKAYNCAQSIEIWSGGAVAGTGFKKCVIEDNIFLNASYCWSDGVRPDQNKRAHIYMQAIETPVMDIKVKNNVFYLSKGSLYCKLWGDTIPEGFDSSENFIFLGEDTVISNLSLQTAIEYESFIQATGLEVDSKFYSVPIASGIDDIISRIICDVGVSVSQNNVLSGILNNLGGKVEELKALIDINSIAIQQLRGYVTSRSNPPTGNSYAPLCRISLPSSGYRYDMLMSYMICGNSVVPRGGTGILDLQVVPNQSTYPNDTAVSLTVFELENLSGYVPSDFVFVTEIVSNKVAGTLYFNIGKQSYNRMAFQSMDIYTANPFPGAYEFYNAATLISTLPDGTQTLGSNVTPTYIKKPTTGTAAPISTPTYIGQEFVDTTNKKVYKATGTSSSTDWVVLN